ncbi:MAG: AAA family ATPase [Chlamydia sp.]
MSSSLFEKIERLNLFDSITCSVVKQLAPQWNGALSLEQFPWLHYISFLAFQGGDTALSLESNRLKLLLKSLFSSSDASNELKFTDEEIDLVLRACLQSIDRDSQKYILYDDSLEPLLSFPFSHHHDLWIARHLYRICSAVPIGDPKTDSITQLIQQQHRSLIDARCNRAQRAAIENSLLAPFSVIYGGPGTGKTYTAGALISLLAHLFYGKHLSQEKKSDTIPPYRVLVAAPTGKAVFTLKNSIEQYFKNIVADINLDRNALYVEALTIHAYVLQQERGSQEIGYHTIIVDECSMIDSELMRKFLSQIQTGVRLILMGDPEQLPPIAPGQPFLDIIRASLSLQEGSVKFPVSHLSSCMRAELQEIIALSESILEKKGDAFFDLLTCDTVQFIESEKKSSALFSFLYQEVAFPWEESHHFSFEEGIELSTKIKILSPVRKSGQVNVETINSSLVTELIKKRSFQDSKRFLDPILITKNNYALQAMNGDIGVIESLYQRDSHKKSLYLPRSGQKLIPEPLCRDYELNYAMSVHKSQGSEFQKVILLLPEASSHISIPLLYTAITRAKRAITIIGKKNVLHDLFLERHIRTTALFRAISEQFNI